MSQDLIFYTNPQSRSRIVRWMLEELNVDYKLEVLEYGTTMKSKEYLAINPMGKVPAIAHKGQVITECAAICAYLADAFPEKGLAPDVANRAEYYRWLFFCAGPLEAAITNKALGVEVPPEKQGFVGYGNFDAVIDALANHLGKNKYVAGDKFTAADVYIGSQIGFGLQFGSLPDRPEFVKYWEGINTRPAFARTVELDKALIKP